MFDKLYDSIIREEADENTFTTKVGLDVDIVGAEFNEGEEVKLSEEEVSLTYYMEIEYRSWGINGISVNPRGKMEFEVSVIDVNDVVLKTIPVNIDFSEVECKIVWQKGQVYKPDSLEEIGRAHV